MASVLSGDEQPPNVRLHPRTQFLADLAPQRVLGMLPWLNPATDEPVRIPWAEGVVADQDGVTTANEREDADAVTWDTQAYREREERCHRLPTCEDLRQCPLDAG